MKKNRKTKKTAKQITWQRSSPTDRKQSLADAHAE